MFARASPVFCKRICQHGATASRPCSPSTRRTIHEGRQEPRRERFQRSSHGYDDQPEQCNPVGVERCQPAFRAVTNPFSWGIDAGKKKSRTAMTLGWLFWRQTLTTDSTVDIFRDGENSTNNKEAKRFSCTCPHCRRRKDN